MLSSFLISLLGHLIVSRIFLKKSAFQSSKTIFLNFFSLFLIIFCTLIIKNAFHACLIIGIFQITLIFFLKFEEKQFIISLKKEFVPILDQIIISMSAGKSFKQSFLEVSKRISPKFKNIIINLYYNREFSNKNITNIEKIATEFVTELIIIEKNQSKCLDKIKNYRRQLQIINNFRRKSGQVRIQSQIQSIVMAFLYFGLLIYVFFEFGFSQYSNLILISFSFFIIGILGVLKIGRSMTWKT